MAILSGPVGLYAMLVLGVTVYVLILVIGMIFVAGHP